MDLATFRELLTPAGRAAQLAAAALGPAESTFLASFEKLRKRYPGALAKAALETVLLRAKGRAKFSAADRMYFTREALEQASGEVVARHRARRFARFEVVADLCCGIGADALALAAAGLTVHAVERDPLLVAMAEANAAALGLTDRIHAYEADALVAALPDVRAVFADPSRRSGGNRHLDPEDYTPPLSALRARFPRDFPLGVKIAPGVAWGDIAGLGAEAEFISVGGELKECVLWFGPLRTAARRATILPAGLAICAEEPPQLPPTSPVREWVYDPDPAVVRAGLVGALAEQLGVFPVDDVVTLFTGTTLIRSRLVTPYRVEFAGHYHPRRLNEYLRERRVGRVTPVQIGSRIDPREVVKRLKLAGREHRFLILTRAGGEQTMIVAERLPSEPEA